MKNSQKQTSSGVTQPAVLSSTGKDNTTVHPSIMYVNNLSDFFVGMRVVRGRNWPKHKTEDFHQGQPGEGLIIKSRIPSGSSENWVRVKWDSDRESDIELSMDRGILTLKLSPNADAIKKLSKPGTKVVRGPDWKYDNQDGGGNSTGKVIGFVDGCPGWVRVKWNGNDKEYRYRIGAEKGKFDIMAAD